MRASTPPEGDAEPAAEGDVADEVVRLRARVALAERWLFVLVLFGGLLAASVSAMGKSDTVYWAVMLLTALLTVGALKASRLPLRAVGLTLGRASTRRGSVVSGTLRSIALLGALGALAVVLAHAGGWLNPSSPLVALRLDGQTLAYVVLAAPLQELVFRGLFQSAAREIFGGSGRRASLAAVTFSTLAFAISHLPWGIETALVMLVPGLIWGKQMERERSLLGVSVSHAVVGYLLVGVSPLWALLRGYA